MSSDQKLFDDLVRRYNIDYYYLLERAGTGSYHCLISSFCVLKDFRDALVQMHDSLQVSYTLIPHQIAFRSNPEFLESLGFSSEKIVKIFGFLDYVKETQGKEFEECLEAGVPIQCRPLTLASGTS